MHNGVIALDCDGVLADWQRAFASYARDALGMRFDMGSYKSYDFWRHIGWSDQYAIKIFKEFQRTDYFRHIRPVAGSLKGVDVIKEYRKLAVITARPPVLEDETKKWFDRHFPYRFDAGIHLSSGHTGTPRIKSDVCDRIGADIIVEDSREFANECAEAGKSVVLLSRGWNKGKTHPNVIRASSWNAVPDRVDELLGQL